MTRPDVSYEELRSRRERAAPRRRRLDAGLPPYRRERLRSESEARILRQIGTPEHLIGPTGTDEEVVAQREDLIAFARALRASARRQA